MRYIAAVLLAGAVHAQNTPDLPLEQTKKNIRVLTGVPSSQLIPIMTVMANSLGVTCTYCHEAQSESDAKPAKQAARRMIEMVRSINEQHYQGQTVVTCNTCHAGSTGTNPVPSLAHAGYHRATVVTAPLTLPAAEELFETYRKAWGSSDALAKIESRVSRGAATVRSGRGDPRSALFELFQEKPNTARLELALPYPPEADREFVHQFFNQIGIRDRYAAVNTVAMETVRGRQVHVVNAVSTGGGIPERLYFDAARGFLLRRERQKPTLVGPLPESYDFDNYRSVDGVFVPFLMIWSRGDYEVTHKVAEVQHNVKPEAGTAAPSP